RLAVAVKISDGFHVNAHKPSFDYLIATDLAFAQADLAGFTLAEPIYPPHVEKSFAFTDGKTLRVYEGTALIGVDASAGRDLKSGPRTLHATLTAQACNDSSCLAPAKLPVEFAVTIAAPDEPTRPVHPEIFDGIKFAGGAFPAQGKSDGTAAEGKGDTE